MTRKQASTFDDLPPDRYFIRREAPADRSVFEESYWCSVVDPDGVSRDRFTERDRFVGNVAEELRTIATLPPGRVLDVGCGPGFMLSGIGDKWEKHGVEPSKVAAEHAERYGKIRCGTLAEAAYPDSYFDLVVLHHVIEHVPDPDVLVREIRRVLSDDGMFIIATPNFDSGCARRFGEKYRMLHDRTHITLFSDESLRRFLKDNGFRVLRSAYPYFDTPYFTRENLLRLEETGKVSPPFYGNLMTFYCRKMTRQEIETLIAHTLAKLLPFALGPSIQPENRGNVAEEMLNRAMRGLE